MKRSKKLTLAMLGVGGAAPLLLTGCNHAPSENNPLYYPDLNSCLIDGVVSDAICRLEYNKAWQTHLMTAPRYKVSRDCQYDFKSLHCQRLASGEYIPTMEGYLIFSRTDNCPGTGDQNYTRQQSHIVHDRSLSIVPVYIDNSSQNTTYSSGNTVQNKDQPNNNKQQAQNNSDNKDPKKESIKTTTKKRGGFGSRSAARGSWGG